MTTWTDASSPTTTWTEEDNNLIQPQTMFNDDNAFNVSVFGKGYYFNDSQDEALYAEVSSPATTWTET